MKTIRFFISSPSDVAPERDKALKVVKGLQKRYHREQIHDAEIGRNLRAYPCRHTDNGAILP